MPPGRGRRLGHGRRRRCSRSTARARQQPDYAPGRSLEFVATFAAAPFQHVGFARHLDAAPWAIVQHGGDGAALLARTNERRTRSDLRPIPGAGSDRRTASASTGPRPASSTRSTARWSRPEYRDRDDDAAARERHDTGRWLGDRRLDADDPVPGHGDVHLTRDRQRAASDLATATWTSAIPSGTALAVSVRTGNTATPDGTWSGFSPLTTSGAQVAATARYLQYRVTLTSTAPTATSAFQSITFTYGG